MRTQTLTFCLRRLELPVFKLFKFCFNFCQEEYPIEFDIFNEEVQSLYDQGSEVIAVSKLETLIN